MALQRNRLEAIDHIVVLMLAGRSFDHMLGFLYADAGNISPAGNPYDGLTGSESNPDSSGRPVQIFRIESDYPNANYMPGARPRSGYEPTNLQVYGKKRPTRFPPNTQWNQGFVKDFEQAIEWSRNNHYPVAQGITADAIMGCFAPNTIPVLSGLARGFAVCDQWFASVPGGTFPNRAFALTGTSQGRMDDKAQSSTAPTIFRLLSDHGLDWAIYGYNNLPLTRRNHDDLNWGSSQGHLGNFSDFQVVAASGTLSPFTFLEPSWGSAGNSQLPTYSIGLGDRFIREVYETLRASPNWSRTLLIITYDHHGGCYDHVAPPGGAVAPDNSTGQFGFDFSRFGVRVPAVLVSPLIAAGTVYRSPVATTPIDYTSILKTIEMRWNLPSLTARDAAAPTLADVLTLETPRADDPLSEIGDSSAVVGETTKTALPPAGTRSRPAFAYVPDTIDPELLLQGEDDALGISDDVDVLAGVIASKSLRPPLSIGIFGDWGAGKSFLINQLRLRIDDLSHSAQTLSAFSGQTSEIYCEAICQIDFNAWQYAEGQQLWASLVNRVFEGVRDYLGSDRRWQNLIEQLTLREQRLRNSQEQYEQAIQDLEHAGQPDNWRTIGDLEDADRSDEELRQAADTYTEIFGLDKGATDIAQVEDRVQDLSTVRGRLREGVQLLRRRKPVTVLVLAVLGIALLAYAAFVPTAYQILTAIAGLSAPLIAVVLGITKLTGDAIRSGQQILTISEQNKARFEEARRNYEQAKRDLDYLTSENAASLYGFVEDRYKTDDYRKYLGLIPLIRRDLEQLGEFSRAGADTPSIDRIVLYIDDLDRCSSGQVVKTLEAINLIFGSPMFVVVVAVDSRWLLDSVKQEYSTIFQGDMTDTPKAYDYLEKFIQIPFWVPTINTASFGRLIDSLTTAPRPQRPGWELANGNREQASHPETDIGSTSAESRATEDRNSSAPAAKNPAEQKEQTGTDRDDVFTLLQPTSAQEMAFTDGEVEHLRKLAPLIPTPRSAKRLLNTYQLLRVTLKDSSTFIGRQEYRVPIYLLGLIVGTPRLSPQMVRSFLDSGEDNLAVYLRKLKDKDCTNWRIVADEILKMDSDAITTAELRQWLPFVGRFSFQAGLAQAVGPV
jgi:phospholipase C